MDAGTCSACTQSQVAHQPYYTEVIDHLNDGLTFSETENHNDLDETVMESMYQRWLRNERHPGETRQPTEAEKEEYLKQFNDWMELKAMTIVPRVYKAYINEDTAEWASATALTDLINNFGRLEVQNRGQNGPDIELEPEEKRKLAVATMAVLNGTSWELGAYRVFHYYLESEARVKDVDEEQTFELTNQTKESSHEQ